MSCSQRNRDDLILQNERLVSWVIKTWYSRHLTGPEHEDIRQAGLLGLVEAARDFDPDKGTFSSFAVQRIRWSIYNAIKDSLLIRPSRDSEAAKLVNIEKVSDLTAPDDPVTTVEENDFIEWVLKRLTKQERLVIEGVVWGGRSVQELAHEMGITRSRVYQLKEQAIKKIQKLAPRP